MCLPSSSYKRHEQLVKAIYPTHAGEIGPRTNALSTLAYYASARPQKLTKIGKCLEKRVKTDIYKQRIGYNRVTLDITSTLITSCGDYINLFVNNVLKIILAIVESNDPDLQIQAASVFVQFNKIQDRKGHNPIAVTDYWRLYGQVVRQFAEVCHWTPLVSAVDPTLQMRCRTAGLRSIRSVAQSQLFSSPDVAMYLRRIIPAVLRNLKGVGATLASPSAAAAPPPPAAETAHQRQHSLALSTADQSESTVESLALLTLQDIAKRGTASTAKYLIEPVFKFFDDALTWQPAHLIYDILRQLTAALQPRYRYLLVSALLMHLTVPGASQQNASTGEAQPAHVPIKRSPIILMTQVQALKELVEKEMDVVGVSVLELGDALCTVMEGCVAAIDAISPTASAAVTPITNNVVIPVNASSLAGEVKLLAHLSDVMASLTLHPSSAPQFPDLLGFILTKLKLPRPPTFPLQHGLRLEKPVSSTTVQSSSGAPKASLTSYRLALLHTLHVMMESKRSKEGAGVVLVPIVVASLGLARAAEPDVRVSTMEWIAENMDASVHHPKRQSFLSAKGDGGETAKISVMTPTMPLAREMHLLQNLTQYIYHYTLSIAHFQHEMAALFRLLCACWRRYRLHALYTFLPMLLTLEEVLEKDVEPADVGRIAAGHALILEFLETVCRDALPEEEPISQYIADLIARRVAAKQHLSLRAVAPRTSASVAPLPSPPLAPYPSPLPDRLSPAHLLVPKTVIAHLSSCHLLAKEMPDLEAKLSPPFITADLAHRHPSESGLNSPFPPVSLHQQAAYPHPPHPYAPSISSQRDPSFLSYGSFVSPTNVGGFGEDDGQWTSMDSGFNSGGPPSAMPPPHPPNDGRPPNGFDVNEKRFSTSDNGSMIVGIEGRGGVEYDLVGGTGTPDTSIFAVGVNSLRHALDGYSESITSPALFQPMLHSRPGSALPGMHHPVDPTRPASRLSSAATTTASDATSPSAVYPIKPAQPGGYTTPSQQLSTASLHQKGEETHHAEKMEAQQQRLRRARRHQEQIDRVLDEINMDNALDDPEFEQVYRHSQRVDKGSYANSIGMMASNQHLGQKDADGQSIGPDSMEEEEIFDFHVQNHDTPPITRMHPPRTLTFSRHSGPPMFDFTHRTPPTTAADFAPPTSSTSSTPPTKK